MIRILLLTAIGLSLNAFAGTHGGGLVLTSFNAPLEASEIELYECRIGKGESPNDFDLALEENGMAQVIFRGDLNEKIDFYLQPYGREIYRTEPMFWHDLEFSYEIQIARSSAAGAELDLQIRQAVVVFFRVYSAATDPAGAEYLCAFTQRLSNSN